MKRIGILAFILCACFVSVAWGQKITCPASVDWTEFHMIDMMRWNPCEKVLTVNNVGNLGLLWSYTTNSVVRSSPAVINGVVYIGSYDGNVYALNAETGAKLWSYATGNLYLDSSPAVANGVVYVSSGNVYALNASTGALLWSYTTGGGSSSTGALLWSYTTGGLYLDSSPAVANGVVYVGSEAGNVYALNASTGALLWSKEASAESSPAVANEVVYVGSGRGGVYALNASTGALLWSYTTGGGPSSPAVANGLVYVGGGDNMYALNASTGALLFSYPTGGEVWSSPAVVNGVVYIGSENDNVYAFGLK